VATDSFVACLRWVDCVLRAADVHREVKADVHNKRASLNEVGVDDLERVEVLRIESSMTRTDEVLQLLRIRDETVSGAGELVRGVGGRLANVGQEVLDIGTGPLNGGPVGCRLAVHGFDWLERLLPKDCWQQLQSDYVVDARDLQSHSLRPLAIRAAELIAAARQEDAATVTAINDLRMMRRIERV